MVFEHMRVVLSDPVTLETTHIDLSKGQISADGLFGVPVHEPAAELMFIPMQRVFHVFSMREAPAQ